MVLVNQNQAKVVRKSNKLIKIINLFFYIFYLQSLFLLTFHHYDKDYYKPYLIQRKG